MKKFIISAIAALCAPFGAHAAIYVQTFTGTVLSGIDYSNEFGGIDLSGQSFVATYTFDSSNASIYNTGDSFSLSKNGTISPNSSTSLTINGFTVSFAGDRTSAIIMTHQSKNTIASATSTTSNFTTLNNYVHDYSLQDYGVYPFSGSVADARYNAGRYYEEGGDSLQLHNLTYSVSVTGFDPINATDPVPEAATWAMMLAGFGLVGTAMRRRRTIVRFA